MDFILMSKQNDSILQIFYVLRIIFIDILLSQSPYSG